MLKDSFIDISRKYLIYPEFIGYIQHGYIQHILDIFSTYLIYSAYIQLSPHCSHLKSKTAVGKTVC